MHFVYFWPVLLNYSQLSSRRNSSAQESNPWSNGLSRLVLTLLPWCFVCSAAKIAERVHKSGKWSAKPRRGSEGESRSFLCFLPNSRELFTESFCKFAVGRIGHFWIWSWDFPMPYHQGCGSGPFAAGSGSCKSKF